MWLPRKNYIHGVIKLKMVKVLNLRDIDENLNEPCISPFSTLEVLYDGTVPLCGCDYKPTVNLGNVQNKSLKEIWNRREKFKKIRGHHASGNRNQISICVGCEI